MLDNHKQSNTDLQNGDICDVLVIGAGPAGALASYLLARRGLKVVLMEKAIFPRYKVCGCCLSPTALQTLRLSGLENLLDEILAVPVDEFCLLTAGKSLAFPLQNFKSVSRSKLDSAIVERAIASGARFLHGHTALISRKGKNELAEAKIKQCTNQSGVELEKYHEWLMQAKVIIVADGLGGTSTQEISELSWKVSTDSHVGVGAISVEASQFYEDGKIYMNYGKGGYLGLVRLENGSTDIAAAFSPHYIQTNNGNIYQSAAKLMKECGAPLPADLDSLTWKGTLPLTRQRTRVAAHRLFVIGDSASYVEPFTGEGIAWALQSAHAVVPVVVQAVAQWHPKLVFKWEREYHKLISRQQSKTKLVTKILRYPQFSAPAIQSLLSLPFAARMLANTIFTPEYIEEKELCAPL